MVWVEGRLLWGGGHPFYTKTIPPFLQETMKGRQMEDPLLPNRVPPRRGGRDKPAT